MKTPATLPRTLALAGSAALLLAAAGPGLAQTAPPAQPPGTALAQAPAAAGTPFTLQQAVDYAVKTTSPCARASSMLSSAT
ncbi:hypothetical protein [Hymenobacter sp. APR13]|uniref:hypothetical protein n=1 Tax=Hymenobacter sp. APR13 TaxID=1356852 RepID=UPI0004E04AF7|nr:hypothetical protein [Hymenobacter sp. APR13]AII53787.1 hypothetical protein N008_17620 [Hymenobacter sp. APR13]